MLPFNENILRMARENSDFQREVLTTGHGQVVLVCIEPNENLGEDTRWGSDEFIICAEGMGAVVVGGEMTPLHRNALIAVPAGTKRDVVNIGREPLRLYVIYSPPAMPAGTVTTRADALAALPA